MFQIFPYVHGRKNVNEKEGVALFFWICFTFECRCVKMKLLSKRGKTMKRIVSFVLFIAMSIALCLSCASCEIGGSETALSYGEKYIYQSYSTDGELKKSEVFVFKKDGSGTYEYSDSSTAVAGTVSFIWEETSDGAIHLFQTDVTYEKNPLGETIRFPNNLLYYSKNMLYYSGEIQTQYLSSIYTHVYVLEGSDLYEQKYGDK